MGTKNLKCFIKIVSIAPIVSCKYTKTILTEVENKILTEFQKGKTCKQYCKNYNGKNVDLAEALGKFNI